MSVKATGDSRTKRELLEEVEQLSGRLDEAEQTLDAIRRGDVDALVVTGPHGEQVFSLTGAERSYRLIVETMNEAALTVSLDGMILFSNRRFCELVKTPMQNIIGQPLAAFFSPSQYPPLREFLADAQARPVQRRFALRAAAGAPVSVQIAASLLVSDALTSICLVATDLTELEEKSNSLRIMGEQQQALEQRGAELQDAATLQSDSCRAALNLMEDAIEARRKSEEASAALQREAEERKRAEEKLQEAHDQLEAKVKQRTEELSKVNAMLIQEVEKHKKAEIEIRKAYLEIERLKDKAEAESVYLQHDVSQEYNFGEIIGRCNAISYVFFRIEQVAPQEATVLLLGETGTGKGVVARAIHNRSPRRGRALVTVNCTALPANLIESELFGREKGAFTGADARQMGRFELADGGTIFLDEIGEMPLELQSKLLRVIQDGEFERLGSPRTVKIDVRIIAASNRNLEEEIRLGRFRSDLFYRLNVFPITIPPLRQRKEDIPLLVDHFVSKFNKKMGKKIETVPKETLRALQEYDWPGNVRELENVIERAVIVSPGPTLKVLDRLQSAQKPGDQIEADVQDLVELEREHIVRVLRKTRWRIEGDKGAAVLLGLNPSTLRARMRKYGILRHQMEEG